MFKKLFSKSKFHLDSLLSPLKRCQRPLTSHFRAGGGVGGLRQRCRALAGSATPELSVPGVATLAAAARS